MSKELRGGMSKNSFGGRKRLDLLDLNKFRSANYSPEQMLYLATIQDAAHNYLFFGLGRNGTSADEFIKAHKYFFVVRSIDIKPTNLSQAQFSAMCFDKQYEYSGLEDVMSITKFLAQLQAERRSIIRDNITQVRSYMVKLQNKLCTKVKYSHLVANPTLIKMLVSPTSSSLYKLLYQTKIGPQSESSKDNSS